MKIKILLGSLLVVAAMAFISCAPAPATPVKETVVVPQTVVAPQTVVVQVTAAPPPTKAPEPTKAVDLAAIQAAWKGGPHNNQYDLYRGPNTYCAVCHSPRNWDPAAKVGTAPNCFSCKFPYDTAVRKNPNDRFLTAAEWKPIGCDICHPDGKGPKIAIWNNGTGKYDPVLTTTQLCEKCHTDSLGATRHQVRLGGGAHSNQIGTTKHRPDQCTDCHNPHSGAASCTNCHTSLSKIAGHDAAHANVRCVACHDRSKMDIGFEQVPDRERSAAVQQSKIFGTIRSVSTADRKTIWIRSTSHDFNKSVGNACTVCHAPGNKWGIYAFTPTPTRPPTTPTPAATPAATPTR